jgi:hypothetical protein
MADRLLEDEREVNVMFRIGRERLGAWAQHDRKWNVRETVGVTEMNEGGRVLHFAR